MHPGTKQKFWSFCVLTNEQHIGPPLPGSLYQKFLGLIPSPEVDL